MQPNDNNNGIGTVAVGYNMPPRVFRRPGEQGAISGHFGEEDTPAPDMPVPVDVMVHNAERLACRRKPCPPPPPPPPGPRPEPCNCPPRIYHNPADVNVVAGDHITVESTTADDITTYTVGAVPFKVNVDTDIMYGDGVDRPIGVYEYEGDESGLVPGAPQGPHDNMYLRADGEWVMVDQSLDPTSGNSVSNGAVCGGLDTLDAKIDDLDGKIQPIPEEIIHEVVDPSEPSESLDFDNEN